MLFVLFLWHIGDGGQWFFRTDVGEAVALVLGLGVIAAGFGLPLVLPPYPFVQELRAEDRDRVAVCAWSGVMVLWLGTWVVPLPGAWGLVPFGLLVVSLGAVPAMLQSREARLDSERRSQARSSA